MRGVCVIILVDMTVPDAADLERPAICVLVVG